MLRPRHRLQAVCWGLRGPPHLLHCLFQAHRCFIYHSTWLLSCRVGSSSVRAGRSVPCNLYFVSKCHLSVFNVKIGKEAKQEDLVILMKQIQMCQPLQREGRGAASGLRVGGRGRASQGRAATFSLFIGVSHVFVSQTKESGSRGLGCGPALPGTRGTKRNDQGRSCSVCVWGGVAPQAGPGLSTREVRAESRCGPSGSS